jgi:hypothetical protein
MSTLPARVSPRTFHAPAEDRRRAFGSNYAPQSLTYLLHLPFVLGIFAAAVWILPTNGMFVLAALVGSLVCLYVLVDIVFRSAPLRLTTTYGMTVLLGYNVGSFNTWLTMKRGSLTLAESFARDPTSLGHGIAACMVTAAVLFVVGELFERPIFGREFYLSFQSGAFPLVVFTTLVVAAAYAMGKVGFMGVAVDEFGHIDPATQLIMWWFFPAYAYSVCAAFNTTGPTRWVIRVLAVVQTIAMVPFGRRSFAFALMLALIGMRLGRYRLRLPVYKKVLIGIAGVALVTVASVSFLYLRVAGYELKGKGKIGIAARVGGVYELAHKKSPVEVLEMLGTDASTRTFMIAFFSDLLNASQHSTPLLGKDMLYQMQLAVPSVVSRNKLGIGSYGEEILANMRWGFSYTDEANSLLTAGAADFGFIGVLVYPLLLLFMLRVALEWLQSAVPTNLAVIIALAYVHQALATEDSPIGYFLEIRSTILVLIVLYAMARLPTFRLRSPDWRPLGNEGPNIPRIKS